MSIQSINQERGRPGDGRPIGKPTSRALLALAPRTSPAVVVLVLMIVLLTSLGTVRLAHLTEHRYRSVAANPDDTAQPP